MRGKVLPGHIGLYGKINDAESQHGSGRKSRHQFPIQLQEPPPRYNYKRTGLDLRFGARTVKIA